MQFGDLFKGLEEAKKGFEEATKGLKPGLEEAAKGLKPLEEAAKVKTNRGEAHKLEDLEQVVSRPWELPVSQPVLLELCEEHQAILPGTLADAAIRFGEEDVEEHANALRAQQEEAVVLLDERKHKRHATLHSCSASSVHPGFRVLPV